MKKNTIDLQLLFGQRLRQVRIEVGLSQEELAFRAGLDRTYISSVERGKRNISLTNICLIAKALGVKSSFLLEGVEIK
jgi:transcriptional regulator with XRE-family HTH domain